MLKLIIRELKSRKFRAFLAGGVVVLAGKLGLDIANVQEFVALVCAYILGVAVEDMGKSKAQIEAAKAPELLPPSA